MRLEAVADPLADPRTDRFCVPELDCALVGGMRLRVGDARGANLARLLAALLACHPDPAALRWTVHRAERSGPGWAGAGPPPLLDARDPRLLAGAAVPPAGGSVVVVVAARPEAAEEVRGGLARGDLRRALAAAELGVLHEGFRTDAVLLARPGAAWVHDLAGLLQPPDPPAAEWEVAPVPRPRPRRERWILAALAAPLAVALVVGLVLVAGRTGSGRPALVFPTPAPASPRPLPAPLPRAALAYDARRVQLVMFGGFEVGAYDVSDTWTWTGGLWTERRVSPQPRLRTTPAVVGQPGSGDVLMFGGSIDFSDTWLWDGSRWTELHPAHTPYPSAFPSMSFEAGAPLLVTIDREAAAPDPRHRQVHRFRFAGGDWVELPADDPPVVSGAPIITPDIYGGAQVLVAPTVEGPRTWIWNGSRWHQTDAATPEAVGRGEAQMVFDPHDDDVLLVTRTVPAVTYRWTGSAWVELAGAGTPRAVAAVSGDSPISEPVLVGGPDEAHEYDTVYLLVNGGWTALPEARASPR